MFLGNLCANLFTGTHYVHICYICLESLRQSGKSSLMSWPGVKLISKTNRTKWPRPLVHFTLRYVTSGGSLVIHLRVKCTGPSGKGIQLQDIYNIKVFYFTAHFSLRVIPVCFFSLSPGPSDAVGRSQVTGLGR